MIQISIKVMIIIVLLDYQCQLDDVQRETRKSLFFFFKILSLQILISINKRWHGFSDSIVNVKLSDETENKESFRDYHNTPAYKRVIPIEPYPSFAGDHIYPNMSRHLLTTKIDLESDSNIKLDKAPLGRDVFINNYHINHENQSLDLNTIYKSNFKKPTINDYKTLRGSQDYLIDRRGKYGKNPQPPPPTFETTSQEHFKNNTPFILDEISNKNVLKDYQLISHLDKQMIPVKKDSYNQLHNPFFEDSNLMKETKESPRSRQRDRIDFNFKSKSSIDWTGSNKLKLPPLPPSSCRLDRSISIVSKASMFDSNTDFKLETSTYKSNYQPNSFICMSKAYNMVNSSGESKLK
jgi:hypothetical protein